MSLSWAVISARLGKLAEHSNHLFQVGDLSLNLNNFVVACLRETGACFLVTQLQAEEFLRVF